MFSASSLWKWIAYSTFNFNLSRHFSQRNPTSFSYRNQNRFRYWHWNSGTNSNCQQSQQQYQYPQQSCGRLIKKGESVDRGALPLKFPFFLGFTFLTLAFTADCQGQSNFDNKSGRCRHCGQEASNCKCGQDSKSLPENKHSKYNCSGSDSNTSNNFHWNSMKPVRFEKDDLTHSFLMKQANVLTIDAVTRILTETLCAIEDYHVQYRQLITAMMEIMEESRSCSECRRELLECKLIVARSNIDEMKKSLIQLESYLESVCRLAMAAAETSFLANAEYASIALMERLHSANVQLSSIKEKTTELERCSTELQALIIVESGRGLK